MSRNPRAGASCRPTSNPCPESAGATALASGRPPRYVKPVGKTSIPKRGPPPTLPKKLDYKRPQMTRAMEQRLKHTQKLQEEMERKERERAQAVCARRPRRTAAPIGGDARAGRERPTRSAEERGRCRPTSREPPSKATCPAAPAASAAPAGQDESAACPLSRQASAGVSARTRNLAKSMNADIVQAEPLQAGPVDNVIIPPGALNADRTTIVSIPQPEAAPSGGHLPSSTMHHHTTGVGAANRSMQVINETLDEQDATEAAVVNTKLQDLQQARRDFVMAVANVGGNAINLLEDDLANVTPIADISPPLLSTPEPPERYLYRCPSLEDPCLQIQFDRHHPIVESAREYLRSRPVDRYVADFMDHDDVCGPDNDDDYYSNLPRRRGPYPGDPLMDLNRLERFFDLQGNPPVPQTSYQAPQPTGPPRGRECLPEDLWEIDDPWYIEPEVPDLIEW